MERGDSIQRQQSAVFVWLWWFRIWKTDGTEWTTITSVGFWWFQIWRTTPFEGLVLCDSRSTKLFLSRCQVTSRQNGSVFSSFIGRACFHLCSVAGSVLQCFVIFKAEWVISFRVNIQVCGGGSKNLPAKINLTRHWVHLPKSMFVAMRGSQGDLPLQDDTVQSVKHRSLCLPEWVALMWSVWGWQLRFVRSIAFEHEDDNSHPPPPSQP